MTKKGAAARRKPKRTFDTKEFIGILANLAGEPIDSTEGASELDGLFDSGIQEIGHSQFNEILLFLNCDRICLELFDFIADGQIGEGANSRIRSMDNLREGLARFQKLALFAYGNVKFGYKRWARNPDDLKTWIEFLRPISDERYRARSPQAIPLIEIAAEDRYMLGYISGREIEERLQNNPRSTIAKNAKRRRDKIVNIGTKNQVAYLTSDYLDVYVATSMREQHDYLSVAKVTKEIFDHADLQSLNLRWFDPTLAFCDDRIDKGLAEALMLKRARCTLFLVQETDTLGKDSELASTLAQGKPVIAFVPNGDEAFVKELLLTLKKIHSNKSENELIVDQLPIYAPKLAWRDKQLREWLNDPKSAPKEKLKSLFAKEVKRHYDSRAKTLQESHPLGIQVHLSSGVAVGVLVVRNAHDCVRLIRRIMLGEYSFRVNEERRAGDSTVKHLTLREEVSGSVFRVMTYDKTLTHTFWNFYLH